MLQISLSQPVFVSVVISFYFPNNFYLFNLVVIVLEDNSIFESHFVAAQHREVFSDCPVVGI